jgi:hypothetical protein
LKPRFNLDFNSIYFILCFSTKGQLLFKFCLIYIAIVLPNIDQKIKVAGLDCLIAGLADLAVGLAGL